MALDPEANRTVWNACDVLCHKLLLKYVNQFESIMNHRSESPSQNTSLGPCSSFDLSLLYRHIRSFLMFLTVWSWSFWKKWWKRLTAKSFHSFPFFDDWCPAFQLSATRGTASGWAEGRWAWKIHRPQGRKQEPAPGAVFAFVFGWQSGRSVVTLSDKQFTIIYSISSSVIDKSWPYLCYTSKHKHKI